MGTEIQENSSLPLKIRVLMVDDQAMLCEAVRRMLQSHEDIEFESTTEATKAIEIAEEFQPTVILIDLVMPDIDGLTLVKFFRAKPSLKNIPMIVLSSKEEAETKMKAFQLGANDYLVKLPDPIEVVARIRYHSNGYLNLLKRSLAEAALRKELDDAAQYVRSLFPERIHGQQVNADWVFMSSTDLAGDSFGYYWLDDEHFVIYLLDVCGHGVGAALHSVSVLNVLRSQSLPGVDFKDPSMVLSGLNEAFDMDNHNQMYFTMWYGVYSKTPRTLCYASGGHPPAVLIRTTDEPKTPTFLGASGVVIGGMPGSQFESKTVSIASGDLLYIFSDGVYEVDYADGHGMMTEEEFANQLCVAAPEKLSKAESMVQFVREAQGHDSFEDDFSLLEIGFK